MSTDYTDGSAEISSCLRNGIEVNISFMDDQDQAQLTYEIIGAAMKVHNTLGPGLREKPYENALCIELRNNGFSLVQQRPIPIHYEGEVVGDCIPDIIVNRQIVIEGKSIETIGDNEVAQVLNYLRIGKFKRGLILNFKPARMETKRVAF
jgi:GxxExxY protein